jgi:hypothetical protein
MVHLLRPRIPPFLPVALLVILGICSFGRQSAQQAACARRVTLDPANFNVQTVFTGRTPGELRVKFGFFEAPLFLPSQQWFVFADQWDECGQEWPVPGLCDPSFPSTGLLAYDAQSEQRTVFELIKDPSANFCGAALDPLTGGLLLADMKGRRVVRWTRSSRGVWEMETLASHLGGQRLNGPDDLVARSDGVVYFSDVAFEPNAPAFGAPEISFQGLYSLRNGTIHLESNDARFCNGVALSPDEKKVLLPGHGRGCDRPMGRVAERRTHEPAHAAPIERARLSRRDDCPQVGRAALRRHD